MQLHRSEKAKCELGAKTRALNLRERGALFLADGRKTRHEMQALLKDDGSMLQKLIADGYLVSGAAGAVAQDVLPSPRMLAVAAIPVTQADNFEGKRSLATTRMFLFDICERMFVRNMPALATQLRDQLREARDRDSMIATARDIIFHVEEIAGAERADGLSERIAMLLPLEPATASRNPS